MFGHSHIVMHLNLPGAAAIAKILGLGLGFGPLRWRTGITYQVYHMHGYWITYIFVINNVHTGQKLRTVVLVKVVTVAGQSVFLRGGIDYSQRPGLNITRSDKI